MSTREERLRDNVKRDKLINECCVNKAIKGTSSCKASFQTCAYTCSI